MMNVKQIKGMPLAGDLIYSIREHSFRFEVRSKKRLGELVGSGGRTSFVAGTLQLEVAVTTNQALFVWGLHSQNQWIQERLTPPPRKAKGLIVAPETTLAPGVSVRLVPEDSCRTLFDESNSWVKVCLGSRVGEDNHSEIADNVVLGFRGSDLRSIWLHPRFE